MASKDEVIDAVSDLKLVYAELRSAKGIKGIIAAIPLIIEKVEQISKDLGIKGADKKELALDILFALVKLPWYLPKILARMILGHLIELAVTAYKKYKNK